jgi:hypothetical protein
MTRLADIVLPDHVRQRDGHRDLVSFIDFTFAKQRQLIHAAADDARRADDDAATDDADDAREVALENVARVLDSARIMTAACTRIRESLGSMPASENLHTKRHPTADVNRDQALSCSYA